MLATINRTIRIGIIRNRTSVKQVAKKLVGLKIIEGSRRKFFMVAMQPQISMLCFLFTTLIFFNFLVPGISAEQLKRKRTTEVKGNNGI